MTRHATAVRLAEALAPLSLATDLGHGLPLESSLRDAIVATRLADRAGLTPPERSDVFYVSMLRSIGCTAFSHELAALLGGDDIAFEALLPRLDPAHPTELARGLITGMGAWAPPLARPWIVARFVRLGPTVAPRAGRSACEVSARLGQRLGLAGGVAAGLSHIYERFDGKGVPDGLRGEALALPARVVHVAAVGSLAHREQGLEAATRAVAHRSGGHLDPQLAATFAARAGELLDGVETGDALAAALEAEPAPHARLAASELGRLVLAFADFADLKSPWTLGHSSRTAELAAAACDGAAEDEDALRLAGLLHDLGRVSVPNGIWDKAGPLSAGEWERVRLHPHWTQRILARTPVFAGIAAAAAADHERLDGSGYHRGLDAASLDRRARLLATADAYVAMTSDRPHRAALTPASAAAELRADAREGRLCAEATEAVLAAAGHVPRRRAERPHGLTEREIEVLRLTARGLTNKEIAAELVVSPRTVQHHLAHVYEKTGRRTRAGAALFATEHGLVER